MIFFSESDIETQGIGQKIGSKVPKNSIICLFGDLGAGKTTLIKGLTASAALFPSEHVCSPTFTYLNIYHGSLNIYHFDLYRIHDMDEFISMGFDEYFFADGICCIEWSERIQSILPSNCIQITLRHAGENKRSIEIKGLSEEL